MAEVSQDMLLQRKQLQQSIPILIVILTLFLISYLMIFFSTMEWAFLMSATGLFLADAGAIVAWYLLRKQHMLPAILAVCVGLLSVLLCGVLAFPSAYAAVVLGYVMLTLIALPHLHGRMLIGFLGVCWLFALATMLIGVYVQIFPEPPRNYIQPLQVVGAMAAVAIVLALLWQYHQRLTVTLTQAFSANAALREIQTTLESQVADRTAALQSALDAVEANASAQAQLLEELALKNEVIRELSIPVLPISENTLVMPLVGALDSSRLRHVQEQALHAIETSRARRLLLDITGVPIVDSQVAQGLISVVQAARLLGAEVVLVGIRPEVAQAMVQLGLDLKGITTHSQLQQGIAMV